jgi:NitT/TauT family transport system permease protein
LTWEVKVIRKPIPTSTGNLLVAASLACLFGWYSYLSYAQHQLNEKDTTIPSWLQLADGVVTIVTPNARTGDVWLAVDSAATFSRLFIGLGIGVLGAFLLGILMGCSAHVEKLFRLPLSAFARIPPTAAMAVFFVLVGIKTPMFVAMIVFGILPTLALSTFLSVKDVPDELVYKGYTLGGTHGEVIWDVIVKIVFPRFIDATRLVIGPAVVALIAAEMLVGDVGFGYRIRLQGRLMNMNVVYPYLGVLMAFGYLMDAALRTLQRTACKWFVTGNGR